MRFDWQNSEDEIRGLRSHNTKDFPHPTDPSKRIKIQYGGLLHAYTGRGFEDIDRELPSYVFPEGIELKEQQPEHFIMDLPEWGEAKVEDGGKVVRVFDKKGVSIFKYSNPIVIEKGKAPFKIIGKDGKKIRDAFSARERLAFDEKLVNSEAVDEGTYEVEGNNLYLRLPTLLKNAYPLQAYDATDTSSTNNKDCQIIENAPTFNYGATTYGYVQWATGVIYHVLMEWTLSSGSGTVTKVELFLYSFSPKSGSPVIAAHELTQAFVEGTGNGSATEDGATWNTYDGSNAWSSAGGDYDATIVDETTVDSINSYFGWVLLGEGASNPMTLTWEDTFDLLFKIKTESGGTVYCRFNTKEAASNKPYIEITYTPPITEKSSSDTGSGAEAKALTATLTRSETGSGVEGLLSRGLFAAQTGSGVDTLLALLGKVVSETGSGVENIYLKIIEGVKESSDSGSGAESSSLEALFQRIETALGTDAVIARALYAKEYPTGAIDLAKVLTVALTGSETGTGAEQSLRVVFFKRDDTGSGVDASTLEALFSRDDVGTGAEAITLLAAMIASDTGVGVGTVLSYLRKLVDSGEGSEVVQLIGYIGRAMRAFTYKMPYFDTRLYTRGETMDTQVFRREATVPIWVDNKTWAGAYANPTQGFVITIWKPDGTKAVDAQDMDVVETGKYVYYYNSQSDDPTGWWPYECKGVDGSGESAKTVNPMGSFKLK